MTRHARHARQTAVAGFGAAGQQRLRDATVLVVGAGGLAAPVLQYLVGAGLGALRLVDPDRVALSNLHRQTLFTTADIGHPKVTAATERMAALDPDCRISPHLCALGPDNVADLADGADLVLDCADSFAVSYILSDFCLAAGLPLISASVVDCAGYCGGFCGGAPSLRAVFPTLPPQMGSCAVNGVLGPVVGMVGALQASMALSVLAGLAPSPLGQLVTLDAAGNHFGGFRFDGAPEPDHAPAFIAPSDLRPEDVVIDLRAPDEAPLATPEARRATVDSLCDLALPDPGARMALCCRSGLRAWHGAQKLAPVWPGEIVLVAFGGGE